MNERIFELIQSQNGFSGLVWTEEDKQEFAESIVQECVMRCGAVQGAAELRLGKNSEFARGAERCRTLIEKDFGVEK